jgi:hypothetical protein
MRSRIVVLACIIAGAPLPLSAQQQVAAQPQETTRQQNTVPDPLWQTASSNNWYVRLVGPAGDTVAGRVRYSGGQARIAGDAVPEAILRIERRVERGNGALAGGVIGVLAGGVMGARVIAGLSSNGSSSAALWGFSAGGGIGGIIGALAGHAAAPGRIDWEPVWTQSHPDR